MGEKVQPAALDGLELPGDIPQDGRANFRCVNFTKTIVSLSDEVLSFATMEGANLSGMDMSSTALNGADLTRATSAAPT